MANLSRKEFLKLTSWGLLASLLPVERIGALTLDSKNQNGSTTDFESALLLAIEGKRLFYLKRYSVAETKYLQAIQLAPNYIQFYDGLDRVLRAQHKMLDSVLLFKNALEITQNQNKVAFYDRAARSLMRLETGNRSAAQSYKNTINSSSLLYDAQTLYNAAIAIDANKTYLLVGLNKINAKINVAPLAPNFKVNRVFKNLKTINKNTYNGLINSKTNSEIKDLINKIDLKERRELFDIKEIEERQINILKQKKKFHLILHKRNDLLGQERIENAEELFNIDYKDPYSLKRVKSIYYSNNRYFDFIDIRRNFANATRTFYGQLGLMDSMEIAFKKGQAPFTILDETVDVGLDVLNTWSLNFDKEVELVLKITKIRVLQNRTSEGISMVEDIMPRVKTNNVGINNSLIFAYANLFYHQGNFEKAMNILLIGLKEIDQTTIDNLIQQDGKLIMVVQLANNKTNNILNKNLKLYYLLYNVYFNQNKTDKMNDIINLLLDNNPNDSFVLSRT